jgi:hypothetical protein
VAQICCHGLGNEAANGFAALGAAFSGLLLELVGDVAEVFTPPGSSKTENVRRLESLPRLIE